ncbi:hypothetical protein PBV87_12725 [Niameybacter massiliensis]|uniref:Uncharacterized protein n=1 Tax=Holtiella tumoricola TaxID=3018743 RepID=A0AA42DN56_9FIRM|nr:MULTISPECIES: hypothetical protein [Lachnospirales]MDA3732352.1 hypothetical protein [Holtiella tumoricola]
MMKGIWIRSQDGTTLTLCKTVKAWESGRIVNNYGKDYVHLGDYGTKERAKEVMAIIANFIQNKTKDDEVFQMPLN